MTTIAFIGLGNMGNPMAANLVKAGYRVIGFDLVARNREIAAQNGVEISHGGAAALAEAKTIITMLSKGSQVVEVYGELAPMAQPGSLFVDCSTIDVNSARSAHAMADDYGHFSDDAPVNGNVEIATEGTLSIMVGGADQAVAMAHSILSKVGTTIIHCGGPGSGQAAKICNNLILGTSMIGVAEAFVLAGQLGLSPEALYEVASSSSGQCWSLTHHCPVPGPVPAAPANHEYKPAFASTLMFKDLKLAQETAMEVGAVTPMTAQAAQLFALHNRSGNGGRDFSSIIELFTRKPA